MTIEDRAKSAAKDIEGKGQEVVGKATGSSQDEAAGKAKQAVAKAGEKIEDAKDSVVDKAKQVAGKVRDGIDDMKDNVKDNMR
jgi:uncharacterized protein YjbJ (UPF0337 family)